MSLPCLPGDWATQAWVGEVCGTKQEAEERAAPYVIANLEEFEGGRWNEDDEDEDGEAELERCRTLLQRCAASEAIYSKIFR